MTREELFKKYSIDESHNEWSHTIDNWMSVEVYRLMHDGKLPGPESNDRTTKWVTGFLDKFGKDKEFTSSLMQRNDWGSLFLTAKRMVYRHAEQILQEHEAN